MLLMKWQQQSVGELLMRLLFIQIMEVIFRLATVYTLLHLSNIENHK